MFSSAATENGKQAMKTAIAGVASVYVTRLFHLPEGYWASITALIVMQSNVGATLSASRTRLAGTAVGALVGGAFTALWGVNMLSFGLAVTVAFSLCSILRLPDSQRLATVTVAIIMLIGQPVFPWTVALHRFIEVSIGILIALVISLTLWPNRARESLREGLAGALVKLGVLYQAVMSSDGAAEVPSLDALNAEVEDLFRKNAALLENALQEKFGPMRERESLSLLTAQMERIRRAVEAVEVALRGRAAETDSRSFAAKREQSRAATAAAFGSIANCLRSGELEPDWPDVMAPISELDKRAPMDGPADYPLLLSTRNLAQELELTRDLVNSRFVSK
jgi:uncharacterized membrane protein YccC